MDPHTILLSEPVTLPQVRSELELVRTRIFDFTKEYLPCFSADGELLALIQMGKWAPEVHIIDTQSGEKRSSFYTKRHQASGAAFPQDKQQLAILVDMKVEFWDISSSKLLMNMEIIEKYHVHLQANPRSWYRKEACCIAFTPDNKLAIGTSEGTIELGISRSEICVETPEDETRTRIEAVAFSPDGTLLASGAVDHRIVIRDVRSGKVICSHVDGMTFNSFLELGAISFSFDSQRLAYTAPKDTVQVWDVKSRKLLQTLDCSKEVRLVSATINGTVRFWAEKESNKF